MDKATRQDDPSDTAGLSQYIDETCDRFEAAWRAGARPHLEDHLGAVAEPARTELLRDLLAVELAYRNRLGERPQAAEYRERFPGDDGAIAAAFAAASPRAQADDRGGRWTAIDPMGRGADGADEATLLGSRPSEDRDAGHPSRTAVPGYEILSELGRGGMGVVYKARQLHLNRPCALKMVLAGRHADANAAIRFLSEAVTAAKLRHPHVVQIYSLGDCDGTPYFEMEFVEGGSLSQRLDGTPWPPHPAARLVATLARAIEEAHRRGIVHRDLKPSNVLLTADGTPKIGDFGLAKSLAGDLGLTQSGDIIGSPSYMAPEQAEGKTRAADPAADIYSLGAILYELLTGRPPFKAATVLQTLDLVRAQEPVAPTRLQPSVPRDLETICLKCLQKDPRRRFAAAGALAEDLERFLTERPILARSTGAVERGWKWARRRPAVALLSAAVTAVTVLGFSLVAWLWRDAERARRDAVEKRAQLTFYQGLALCDRGEVGRGLLWLTRSLELATEADAHDLGRAIRVNLADWQDQLIRPRRLPALRHSATERVPILGCVFRDDGRALVAVGDDRVARTWDAATGAEIGPPLEIEPDPSGASRLESATFDPPEDGRLVAVDDRGRVTSWDLDRRRPSATPLVLPPGHRARGVAFSPRLQRVVASSDEGTLQWWDGATRAPIGEPQRHDRGKVTTMALSRDGRTLVTGGDDRQVIRWEMATGRRLGPELFYDSPVAAIALAPDGRKVFAGTRAGQLHVWDAEAGRGFDLPPQGTAVTSLAVSADGRVFASGTEGGVIRVWDATMLGQVGQTIKLPGTIGSLAFDPGGTTLAMGGDDGTIRLYEVSRPQALGPPLRIGDPVQTLTFGTDGRRLLIGSASGPRWWDLTGRRAPEPSPPEDLHRSNEPGRDRPSPAHLAMGERTEAMAVSPDGQTLAIARRVKDAQGRIRGRAELWDVATGAYLRETPAQRPGPSGVAYSPDSKWLLTWGPEPGTAWLRDAATLQAGRPLCRSQEFTILQAAFSRDGRTLLLGCRDNRARLWDLERDVEIASKLRPRHAYSITAVAFDPHRARVVTGCYAGTVRLWDATEGTILTEMRENAGEIVVLVFSPDGQTILTASRDGKARFLEAESGRQLGPSLHHTDAVLCAAFHPDGQSAVTGTKGGIVQRWRVPHPPRTGSVAEIRRWVQEQTGMHLDDQGTVIQTAR